MVFVVDDFLAWLIELISDVGSKKLRKFVFGDKQEAALERAVRVAVELTAEELLPEGGEQAIHLAMVISEVIRSPMPSIAVAEHATILESLGAGNRQPDGSPG